MTTKWSELCNLSEHLLQVIHNFGFESVTPVQVATIPVFLKNKDVCVEAVTGSGKTLAFVVPMLEMLLKQKHTLKKYQIGAVIISPTRELASQIYEVVKSFHDAEKCSFSSMLCIGGQGNTDHDFSSFQENGANILIGTPGRISAVFEKCPQFQKAVKSLEVFILDEADRLLDMGFHRTITTIIGYLPKQRRTGLFSATQTEEVEQLVKAGMRNPVKIVVKEKKEKVEFAAQSATDSAKTPSTLSNSYMICKASTKLNRLMNFIAQRKKEKFLVFVATCASVEYFGRAIKDLLHSASYNRQVLLLHGKVKKRRLQIFNKFKEMKSAILVCTDVMARGVDIPDVDWVLQYDPPSNASAFVHRCGRTARIGRQGEALIFLLESEAAYVDFVEINQKAPMMMHIPNERGCEETDWVSPLRAMAQRDRAVMERGTRAFVSYIQSYAKHECNLIFRIKDLPFGELATGFGLLKMPKMPELRNKKITGFAELDIATASIPYRDKAREKQRQAELKRRLTDKESRPKFMSKKAKAWCDTKLKKENKKQKREQRRKRKEKMAFDDNEMEELRKDAQLVKKLKNRKISKAEYERQMDAEAESLIGETDTS